MLSPSLDLCDLRGVYAFAEKLCTEPVSNPEGLEGEYLRDVRIPRLDSVVFNAAYGGWTGCNYPLAIWSFFTQGLIQIATWPSFKNALPTCILNVRSVYNYVSYLFRELSVTLLLPPLEELSNRGPCLCYINSPTNPS